VRVYVASKFEEKEYVAELYEWLREDGHVITHDWTGEDDAGKSGAELDTYHTKCARQDVDGVMEAEAVVLLPHDRGKGLYVEMGIAIGLGLPIVCWKYDGTLPECIFLKHPDVIHVDTQKGVLEALRDIELGEDR
jgi:hypothetical protein